MLSFLDSCLVFLQHIFLLPTDLLWIPIIISVINLKIFLGSHYYLTHPGVTVSYSRGSSLNQDSHLLEVQLTHRLKVHVPMIQVSVPLTNIERFTTYYGIGKQVATEIMNIKFS